MSIEYVADDSVGYIRVSDELDMATAGKLRDMGELAFADAYVSTLRIDLSEVPFMDSTGIGALVAIRLVADEGNHVLIIENPSARVLRVLDLTGLTEHFRIK